jgi:anti-sigma factor RsiW
MMAGKSPMRSQRSNETWHVKYLLGDLIEEEQVQVEDRAFADADYLSALEATEADLIDAYVRGELSPADRRSFEFRFLTSPERRRKVEFARALATIASESKTQEPRAAGRPSLLRAFWGWNPVVQFAAAMAALICIAGGSWLVSENAAIRSRVAALEAERRDFELREQSLRQRLSEEQSRAAALSAPNRQPSEAAVAPLVASLVLVPGLSRAQTRVEQLVLSPSVQIARIEIELESRDDYPRFRAELRTRRGEEVLSRSNLVRRKAGPGFAVSVDVPASALAVGDYELALKGIAADQTSQDVGYYYFGVQRR